MKIAQISPLIESVPPRLYGGTERVVSYLTEELVAQGHDVTLFASGDSMTGAKLVPCSSVALRLDTTAHDPIPHYMVMLDKVMRHAVEIRHSAFPHRPSAVSVGPRGRPASPSPRCTEGRTCPTARCSIPTFGAHRLSRYRTRSVSLSPTHISSARCITASPSTCIGRALEGEGGYLAFLGRISPEKDPGPGDPDRARRKLALEDRRQGRRRGRGLFSRAGVPVA